MIQFLLRTLKYETDGDIKSRVRDYNIPQRPNKVTGGLETRRKCKTIKTRVLLRTATILSRVRWSEETSSHLNFSDNQPVKTGLKKHTDI